MYPWTRKHGVLRCAFAERQDTYIQRGKNSTHTHDAPDHQVHVKILLHTHACMHACMHMLITLVIEIACPDNNRSGARISMQVKPGSNRSGCPLFMCPLVCVSMCTATCPLPLDPNYTLIYAC